MDSQNMLLSLNYDNDMGHKFAIIKGTSAQISPHTS